MSFTAASPRPLKSVTPDQVTGPQAFHGEGPVWSGNWEELRYLDMLAGDVHRLNIDTGALRRVHLSNVVAAIRPRTMGGMVAATERGFALVDDDFNVDELGELWSDASIRMNDGGCDPAGAFYCGSMAYDMRPGAGRLYRLAPDRSVTVMLDQVTISNGLAWSPDGETVYYVDTPTQRIDVMSYSGSGFADRRPFARIAEADGSPDGITVDSDGGVWVALWGGSGVRRYAPDGTLDLHIRLPVSQVTACAFGGRELDQLFITTSRQGIDATSQPQAGAIFRITPAATGTEPLPFAG